MTIEPPILIGAITVAGWLGATEWRLRRVERDCSMLLQTSKRIEHSLLSIKLKLGIPIHPNDVDGLMNDMVEIS